MFVPFIPVAGEIMMKIEKYSEIQKILIARIKKTSANFY
jgi:hypothetical protein